MYNSWTISIYIKHCSTLCIYIWRLDPRPRFLLFFSACIYASAAYFNFAGYTHAGAKTGNIRCPAGVAAHNGGRESSHHTRFSSKGWTRVGVVPVVLALCLDTYYICIYNNMRASIHNTSVGAWVHVRERMYTVYFFFKRPGKNMNHTMIIIIVILLRNGWAQCISRNNM